MAEYNLDLVVLVADKDAALALTGILESLQKKGVGRTPRYKIVQAPRHDGEARTKAPHLLRGFLRKAADALVVFDREGCGVNAPPQGIWKRKCWLTSSGTVGRNGPQLW